MNKKYRDEYRRQKRAEWAAQISSLDQEMLELMGRLRRYTYGGELGDNPRARAAKALMRAIDDMAGVRKPSMKEPAGNGRRWRRERRALWRFAHDGGA